MSDGKFPEGRPFDFGHEAGSGARGRQARFSLAEGPAGGSLEYELFLALADVSRLRQQLANERENNEALSRRNRQLDDELRAMEHRHERRAS